MLKEKEKYFNSHYNQILEKITVNEEDFDNKVLFLLEKTSKMDKNIKISLNSLKKMLSKTLKNLLSEKVNKKDNSERISNSFQYSASLINNLNLEYQNLYNKFLEFYEEISKDLVKFDKLKSKQYNILIEDENYRDCDKIDVLNSKTDEFRSSMDDLNSPLSSSNSLNILSNSYMNTKKNKEGDNAITLSNRKKDRKRMLSFPEQAFNLKATTSSNRNIIQDLGSKITLSLENEILQREIEHLTKLMDTPISNTKPLLTNENNNLNILSTSNSIKKIKYNAFSMTEFNITEKLLQEKKKQIKLSSSYLKDYLDCLFNSLNLVNNTKNNYFISISFKDNKSGLNDLINNIKKRNKLCNQINQENINMITEKSNVIIYFKYPDKSRVKENFEEKILICLIVYNLFRKNYMDQISFFEKLLNSFEKCDQGEKKIEKIKLYKNITSLILIRFCETIKNEFENYSVKDTDTVYKNVIIKFLLLFQNSFILKKCFSMWIREILVKFYIFLNIDNQYLDIYNILGNPSERVNLLEIFIKMLNLNYTLKELDKKGSSANTYENKLKQFLQMEKNQKFINLIKEELKCFNIDTNHLSVIDYMFEEESIVSLII